MFKYQEQFSEELAASWANGNYAYVRTTIRNLKNKAQSAYIAASVVVHIRNNNDEQARENAKYFLAYMHPNNLGDNNA